MATNTKEFKLGQRVAIMPGTIQAEAGVIVGSAMIAGEYGASGATLTMTYIVKLDQGGYMVSESGIQRGYVSVLSVHPDNLEIEDPARNSTVASRRDYLNKDS